MALAFPSGDFYVISRSSSFLGLVLHSQNQEIKFSFAGVEEFIQAGDGNWSCAHHLGIHDHGLVN